MSATQIDPLKAIYSLRPEKVAAATQYLSIVLDLHVPATGYRASLWHPVRYAPVHRATSELALCGIQYPTARDYVKQLQPMPSRDIAQVLNQFRIVASNEQPERKK